jgi:uncharacterized membrane protein YiaA
MRFIGKITPEEFVLIVVFIIIYITVFLSSVHDSKNSLLHGLSFGLTIFGAKAIAQLVKSKK